MALTDDIRILQHGDLLARIEAGDALELPPMHVRIEPTEACNFRCGFCWWHGAGRTDQVRAAGDLDFTGKRHLDRDRLLRLIDELADLGTRAVSFTGAGDPLVFPGIGDVLARIHARDLALGVTSNLAMKLDDALVAHLARARWLRWSVNGGSEAVYLATNRPRGGNPSAAYSTACENVARIVRARRDSVRPAAFHASVILFAENESDVLAAARLARDLGLDGVSFRPDTPFERQAEPLTVSPAVADAIALAARTLANPSFSVHHETTRQADVAKLGDPDLVCFYSNHTTYVAATGDVYPCCYTRVDARYAIGNILDRPFADFWRSAGRRASYRRLNFDACPSCPYGPTNQVLGRLYDGRVRAAEVHRPAAEPSPFI